jgi:regulator of protease activity HflC (stomatin/prohibitin superfamily)
MGSDSQNRDVQKQGVLNHLLKVESQASILVDEAQAEADRRVAENEKDSRTRYDERYSLEAAERNGEYEKAVLEVQEDYRRQLEAYRETLAAMPVHADAFSRLADSLLFGDR